MGWIIISSVEFSSQAALASCLLTCFWFIHQSNALALTAHCRQDIKVTGKYASPDTHQWFLWTHVHTCTLSLWVILGFKKWEDRRVSFSIFYLIWISFPSWCHPHTVYPHIVHVFDPPFLPILSGYFPTNVLVDKDASQHDQVMSLPIDHRLYIKA